MPRRRRGRWTRRFALVLIAGGAVLISIEAWRGYNLVDKAATATAAKAAQKRFARAVRESWPGLAVAGIGGVLLVVSVARR
ncbi:MAG: hypothetical protein AAFR38_09195 [Planctomycetota bacterium]